MHTLASKRAQSLFARVLATFGVGKVVLPVVHIKVLFSCCMYIFPTSLLSWTRFWSTKVIKPGLHIVPKALDVAPRDIPLVDAGASQSTYHQRHLQRGIYFLVAIKPNETCFLCH